MMVNGKITICMEMASFTTPIIKSHTKGNGTWISSMEGAKYITMTLLQCLDSMIIQILKTSSKIGNTMRVI